MEWFARLVLRRRKVLLWATLALVLVSGAIGGGVLQKLSNGGFVDSGTESARAAAVLADRFHTGEPNLVLLVSDSRGVEDREVRDGAAALGRSLAGERDVTDVVSYWGTPDSPPVPSLRSRDGNRGLILVRIGGDEDAVNERMKTLGPAYENRPQGLDVQLGGPAEASRELFDQTEKDLVKAEAIAFPIVLVLLVLIFGGVVAAVLPLVLGVVAILGVFLILRILSGVTDVSVLASNVTSGLGLGLSIDYALFIITRYREELRRGAGTDDAIVIAMRTAGRTVLFSALTVALALSSLLVLPFYFLRSFAYAGIPTALLAAVASLVVLPPLLKVLGPRIDKWRVLKSRDRSPDEGLWHRLATFVMRRPVPVMIAGIAVLLVLGAPFLQLKMSLADDRVLPASTRSHQVGDVIRDEFSGQESQALTVVLTGIADPGPVTAYAQRLSGLAGVARVDSAGGSFTRGAALATPGAGSARFARGDAAYLSVVPVDESLSSSGEQLVSAVRAVPAPATALVGGPAAELVDSLHSMNSRLPWVFGIVAVSAAVLLFLLTGSVLLPLKALVLNTLSLSATFGALVWGFQDGHLRGWVGDFTPTGSITWTVPVLLFCIAFGLSMDYEVFLLSRIKEEYDRTGDNQAAVVGGLSRTGRLVTAAATLIAIVFLGFLSSGITYLKAIGLGLAIAVIVDATIVRGLLVPAFMRLAGRANWWAPGPLRRLHDRIGPRESDALPDDERVPVSTAPAPEAGPPKPAPGLGPETTEAGLARPRPR
jgi:putative drug exporter of the RND superfamily